MKTIMLMAVLFACLYGAYSNPIQGLGGLCYYDGIEHKAGDTFKSSDGCNNCVCGEFGIACTNRYCPNLCQYNGQTYFPGQSFKSECNDCDCKESGAVVCTEGACTTLA